MSRVYGALCPECGGLLLSHTDWSRLWCPNNAHSGNGLWVPADEAKEGYVASGRPRALDSESIDSLARAVRAAGGGAARARGADGAAAPAGAADQRPPAPSPAQAARDGQRGASTRKEPKQCMCGCGEWTKGGRFRPGHDARYYARNGGHHE